MFDVAVIVPTYNRSALLPAALDSVLAQTTPARIEVAILDDGSTDITDQVVEPYLRRHGDETGKVVLRYSRLEKQGVVAARNAAIAQTSAALVAFLDSDDYWAPDKLQRQMQAMEQTPEAGVCHSSFRYVDEAGDFQDDGAQRLDNPCRGLCLDTLLDEDVVIFSSVLMRRSLIDRIAVAEPHQLPFDPRWTNAQDYDLLLRSARLAPFVYVPEPLTFYRLHGGHGAMGNLRRAFGFHAQVQLDFVQRHGKELGLDEQEARRRVQRFLRTRATSMFWKRQFAVTRELCDLAQELGVSDAEFAALRAKANRPDWVYKAKDQLDRLLGSVGRKPRA